MRNIEEQKKQEHRGEQPTNANISSSPQPDNLLGKVKETIEGCLTQKKCLPCYLYEEWKKERVESSVQAQIEIPPK